MSEGLSFGMQCGVDQLNAASGHILARRRPRPTEGRIASARTAARRAVDKFRSGAWDGVFCPRCRQVFLIVSELLRVAETGMCGLCSLLDEPAGCVSPLPSLDHLALEGVSVLALPPGWPSLELLDGLPCRVDPDVDLGWEQRERSSSGQVPPPVRCALHPAEVRARVRSVVTEGEADPSCDGAGAIVLATRSPVVLDAFVEAARGDTPDGWERAICRAWAWEGGAPEPYRLVDRFGLDWLAHFSLGDLYSRGEFAAAERGGGA